jgi:hypothetical protein
MSGLACDNHLLSALHRYGLWWFCAADFLDCSPTPWIQLTSDTLNYVAEESKEPGFKMRQFKYIQYSNQHELNDSLQWSPRVPEDSACIHHCARMIFLV